MRSIVIAILFAVAPLARADSDIQAPSSSGELVAPLRLDRFTACLRHNGMKLYGASWCPQCARQRRMFGVAAQGLPYVECSADGKRHGVETGICGKEQIDSYPTWVRADGARRSGVHSLDQLAQFSACPLK